jgi:hypothetical protein
MNIVFNRKWLCFVGDYTDYSPYGGNVPPPTMQSGQPPETGNQPPPIDTAQPEESALTPRPNIPPPPVSLDPIAQMEYERDYTRERGLPPPAFSEEDKIGRAHV